MCLEKQNEIKQNKIKTCSDSHNVLQMSFGFLTLEHRRRHTGYLVSLLGLRLQKPPSMPVQQPCAVSYDYFKKRKRK